jgi:hypothetical protein
MKHYFQTAPGSGNDRLSLHFTPERGCVEDQPQYFTSAACCGWSGRHSRAPTPNQHFRKSRKANGAPFALLFPAWAHVLLSSKSESPRRPVLPARPWFSPLRLGRFFGLAVYRIEEQIALRVGIKSDCAFERELACNAFPDEPAVVWPHAPTGAVATQQKGEIKAATEIVDVRHGHRRAGSPEIPLVISDSFSAITLLKRGGNRSYHSLRTR